MQLHQMPRHAVTYLQAQLKKRYQRAWFNNAPELRKLRVDAEKQAAAVHAAASKAEESAVSALLRSSKSAGAGNYQHVSISIWALLSCKILQM